MTAGLRADVSTRVGDLDVVVDLAAAPGETVAVVGPNGAGKTTLLRALAGLVPLEAGHVTLDDVVFEDGQQYVPPERRPVGIVFQDYALFPHLRVVDNVAFGLRCRGEGRRQARRRAVAWLDRVGLAERAAARVDELSGGERQRVAVARALATQPRLLLLDEPLAALDATTRATLRRDLRRHVDEFDGVCIVVTHDPVDAAALADRVVVMERGHVAQAGTLAEITARPRSPYVADLAGVNLFRGAAVAGRVLLDGGGELRVATAASGPVHVVVHPRAVSLHLREPDSTARNRWRGTVASVDRHADRARVRVDAAPAIVAEVTIAAVSEFGLLPGTPVWLSVKATEVDVYPS